MVLVAVPEGEEFTVGVRIISPYAEGVNHILLERFSRVITLALNPQCRAIF
jgi:hypothetical protein